MKFCKKVLDGIVTESYRVLRLRVKVGCDHVNASLRSHNRFQFVGVTLLCCMGCTIDGKEAL